MTREQLEELEGYYWARLLECQGTNEEDLVSMYTSLWEDTCRELEEGNESPET